MNGFEKRANRIKEKILHKTLEMMRTTDPKGIRIADISKAAEVSQVTIYNYFGSKEALLREVFVDYFDKAVRDFEDNMNEGHSLKEKVAHIIDLEKSAYRDFPPGLIKQMLAEDAELARYIEAMYRERTIPLTVRIIREGQASGVISEDVSIENVLAFIQIYMNQYEALLDMADKSADRDKFLEGMVQMFFYGLSGKR
ncbi:TetR/AcrR family transcriptional regulator [Cohnella yongneupensis]|uniref:TetR/AcrR family transcriptional regulator n=1 Tax=Cohnella yongneupensis TaxID=425006 RepID=A0ABW0QVJ9_9BACL